MNVETRTVAGAQRGGVVASEGARRADLAAIHIAAKALGWSESEYRDILWTVCQVRSSADLDYGGRKRWLAHLQACMRAAGLVAEKRPVAVNRKPLGPRKRLIWALWQQLADAGLVRDRSRTGLIGFMKRLRSVQVDSLEWLNKAQEDLVIESLKQWLKRGAPRDGA